AAGYSRDADVALVGGGIDVRLGQVRGQALGRLGVAAVARGDVGALCGERAADRGADAAGAAGDERGPARELVADPCDLGALLGGCHALSSLPLSLLPSGPSARRAIRR